MKAQTQPPKMRGGGLMALLGPQALAALEQHGAVECRGYGVTLTPWWCLENQLLAWGLLGWPCHECGEAVGIGISAEMQKNMTKIMPKPKRRRAPQGMTPAVARALGLI